MIYANVMRSAISGLTKTAKVKGYKAKEAFRVGKGKAKYAASKVPGQIAGKFPKTTAKAGKYKKATGDAFKTFGKTLFDRFTIKEKRMSKAYCRCRSLAWVKM